MKRIMFVLGFILAFSPNCSDDKDDPDNGKKPGEIEITEMDIPVFTPSVPGSNLTITGKGFDKNDRIKLRPLSSPDNAGSDIEATVVSASDNSIIIAFPSNATHEKGYVIWLIRGDKSEKIGMIRPTGEKAAMPDAALREAMKKINWYAFDEKGNVWIEDAQATAFPQGTINLDDEGISDLSGLEHFSQITKLLANGNNLSKVDLSKFSGLVTVELNHNNITELTVGLQESLTALYAEGNRIKELDVNQCEYLERIYIQDNPLEHLNMGALWRLEFDHIRFTFVDDRNIERTLKLNDWYIYDPEATPTVRFWITGAIRTAGLMGVKISTYKVNGDVVKAEVDFSEFTLDEEFVEIPDANLRDFLKTTWPDIFNSEGKLIVDKAASLVLENNTLNINGKSITSLSGLEYFTSMETLFCTDNNLGNVNLTNFTQLRSLMCWNSGITSITFGRNHKLFNLYAAYNPMTKLDMKSIGGSSFRVLKLNGLSLDELDFRHKWTAIELWGSGEDPNFVIGTPYPKKILIDKYFIDKYDLLNVGGKMPANADGLLKALESGTVLELYKIFYYDDDPEEVEWAKDYPDDKGQLLGTVTTLEEYKALPLELY